MNDKSRESWEKASLSTGLDSGPAGGPESVKRHRQKTSTKWLALSLFCLETMACLESLVRSFLQNLVDDAIV